MTNSIRIVPTLEGRNGPSNTSRKWARKLSNRQAKKVMKLQDRSNWGNNLIKTKHQAWNAIVAQQHLHQLQNAKVIFDKNRVSILNMMLFAILLVAVISCN